MEKSKFTPVTLFRALTMSFGYNATQWQYVKTVSRWTKIGVTRKYIKNDPISRDSLSGKLNFPMKFSHREIAIPSEAECSDLMEPSRDIHLALAYIYVQRSLKNE